MTNVSVIIPTIPPRRQLLYRALDSVMTQTLSPAAVAVSLDSEKQGAAVNRQKALDMVTTEFFAPCDDDDAFEPEHLQKLYEFLVDVDADYVYSHYTVVGGTDPRPENLTAEFDPIGPTQTTIGFLCKTELAKDVGGFVCDEDTYENLTAPGRLYAGEDHLFTKRCVAAGAKIVHLHNERTYRWYHHGSNTSGLPRW